VSRQPSQAAAPWRVSEATCVGAMLVDPERADVVLDIVTRDDFADEQLRRLFCAVEALCERQPPPKFIDPAMVITQIYGNGAEPPEAAEDWRALNEILAGVATAVTAPQHARTVLAFSKLRRLASVGAEIAALAKATRPADADAAVERAQDRILTAFESVEVVRGIAMRDVARAFTVDLDERVNNPKAVQRGLLSGLDQVDKILPAGMQRGRYYVIGAESGGGKTALLCHYVRQACATVEGQILQFSLEMPNADGWARSMAAMADIEAHRLETAHLDDTAVARYVHAANVLVQQAGDRLTMVDSARLTVPMIVREVRRRNRRGAAPVTHVFVDYVQLLRSTGKYRNKEEGVAEIANDILAMTKEYNVCTVLAAQVNRDNKGRARPPQKSDIRDSDQIVFGASGVLIMQKPIDQNAPENRVDLWWVKNRGGPESVAIAAYDRARHSFKNMPDGWGE